MYIITIYLLQKTLAANQEGGVGGVERINIYGDKKIDIE